MIGNKCVIDTSVIIQVFKGSTEAAERLDAMQEVFVPATVIGELKYGAYKSLNPQKHLDQVNFFLEQCKILLIDATTANVYGSIKAALALKGKPIPENDIWIAAIVIQYELPLFANDNHFTEIVKLHLI